MEDFITDVDILDEAKNNFLVYSEEVLTDRAIPSAEDGLLSSQRKILWTMEEILNMNHNSKTKKCGAVVGSTLASAYFHGDQACYGVLTKMSQEYLMRYPLVIGQGGLGTQEANGMVSSPRYCVTGDTYVGTENGLIPIKEIVPNSQENEEYDINLKVQGGFGQIRHASKFFNTGYRDIIKIQLKNGLWIKVTPNHPLLTLDNNLDFQWKLAKNISTQDKLLLSCDESVSCFGTNNDLIEAKMLGCMISEGYATTQNRLGINNKDLAMIQPVIDFIQNKIPYNEAKINYNNIRNYYEYCIADKKFFKNFMLTYEFEKSLNKHLPNCFFKGSKEYQSTCLKYLFEGDGSVDKEHGISYSSISEELIHQLQVVLLQNFGIFSYISRSSIRNEIQLYIDKGHAEKFLKEINFVSERKKTALVELIENYKTKTNVAGGAYSTNSLVTHYLRSHLLQGYAAKARDKTFGSPKRIAQAQEHVSESDFNKAYNIISNYYFIQVSDIQLKEKEIAYSIRIDDDTHSFIGNGFINHNTECKPSQYADLMFLDYKKKIVDEKETYNGEYMEPVVLPALFPNALVNGREAIGIALSHGSLPNNLTEVCNGIIRYIKKNGDVSVRELMEDIQGPDFPLGGTIINKKDILYAYETGKSQVSLKVRGDYIIDGQNIIFTSIPYRTYRNKIKEEINKNIDKFEAVLDDFNDESNIGENRLIFTVKKSANVQTVLNMIFSYTSLQNSLSYNMNFIINGTPKLCSLKTLIKAYVEHQEKIIKRIAEKDKAQAEAKAHILEGLTKAIDVIDDVIEMIKQSASRKEAQTSLMSFLSIDDIQAKAILDMKLAKLTRMDKQELVDDLQKQKEIIAECIKILTDKNYRDELLIDKISKLRDKYGDERRTKLINIDFSKSKEEKEIEDIIPEKCVVVLTEGGTIKRIPASSFRTQKRNGKGIKTQEDITSMILRTNTIDSLMIFTNKGKMYRLLVDDIPTGTNVSKGQLVRNLVTMEPAEEVETIYSIYRDTDAKYVTFITKQGMIKKTPLDEYIKTKKKSGIDAISLRKGDSLVSVVLMSDEPIVLITKLGQMIKFKSTEIGASGRKTIGLRGINLNENDEVIAGLPERDSTDDLAVFSKNGLGKRIKPSELIFQKRAGKGLKCIKGGEISAACFVSETDTLLVCGNHNSICISANEIPVASRTAQGNTILKNDAIKTVSKI